MDERVHEPRVVVVVLAVVGQEAASSRVPHAGARFTRENMRELK